jgi:hypothetical protein
VTRRIKARALSARLESMDVRRDEVFRRVLEVLGAYAVSQGEAEALLASLGTREDFIRLIRAIINDPHWLHLIAENSYRHALGFDKLIVAPLLPTGQLRLHVWWPGDPRTREHIHNHRFAFSSIVVSGRLRNHVFETTRIPEGAKPYRRFVEDAQLRDHRWQFTASGTDLVRPVLVGSFPVSTSYSMFPEVLHRIDALDPLTVTLFIERATTRSGSSVYVEPDSEPPTPRPQGRFTTREVRQRLHDLCGRVERQ